MEYTLLIGIGKGILVGVSAALVGYVKSLPDGEQIDWYKPIPALVIGALAGGVGYSLNIGLDSATELIASFGAVTLVNSLWSALVKKLKSANKGVNIKIKKK